MRLLAILLTFCATSTVAGRAWAQDRSEHSCDGPLVVTRFETSTRTVKFVTDLTAKDLVIKVGDRPAAVKDASVDGGSKRVVVVLDASRKVPQDEWQMQTETAVTLIENARALDCFSLFVVGVDTTVGAFRPLGDMQATIRDLEASRPKTGDDTEKIYDALVAATNSFDPPEFGDAIFLFGHSSDLGSTATASQVEEQILKRGLRLYGINFAGLEMPGEIDRINHETGYFVSFHQLQALNIPGQRELFEGFLTDLYSGIASPYRVSIRTNVTDKAKLELAVTNIAARKINTNDIHYPHFIYPCAAK